MIILAIDTSCDETTASICRNKQIVSSALWSQTSLHSSFGGVMPSLAQRQHQARIDLVIKRAMTVSGLKIDEVDAIAVTIGPGLGIALGVGINKAKELAIKHNKPLIPVNHIEAHLLSPFAGLQELLFPSYGLILSGGTTLLCLVNDIGDYKVLAKTIDDALGEALDKGARLLGLGYPGGAILEKLSKLGDPKKFNLPLPLQSDKIKNRFSYSGLKTAFVRLFESIKDPTKQDLCDLASVFQSKSFEHIEKVFEYQIISSSHTPRPKALLLGGGVANNIEIRKRLRKICKKHNIKLLVPMNKKLNGDNAGMVGVCAYLNNRSGDLKKYFNYDTVDRNPKLSI